MLAGTGRYRVRVACLDARGPLRETVEGIVENISSFPLNNFYDSNAFTQLRRFRQLLRDERIDIVQTHDFYSNIFGMAGGWLARVPIRIAARRETGEWRTAAQKLAERIAYRLSTKIVANSNAVAAHLAGEGVDPAKIPVIYNGLSLDRVALPDTFNRDTSLRSFGLPANQSLQFVTIVANLRHPVKDHPTFLRAARIVRESHPEARFIIAGEGELLDNLKRRAADLGLADSTFFIGRCEKIAELLALSSVCVLSSRAEGLSNSILEYLAAERPVVATRVGGAHELVAEGATGYLVPPGDERAMASSINRLLADTGLAQRMGKAGRVAVIEKFSEEAQLTNTEKLYEDLAWGLRRNQTIAADRVSVLNDSF
jgi:glycosyltransferase involved in cell wall biosynthesis